MKLGKIPLLQNLNFLLSQRGKNQIMCWPRFGSRFSWSSSHVIALWIVIVIHKFQSNLFYRGQ